MKQMVFGLHAAVVQDRNAIGHLMCRERMSRPGRATLAQHGGCERQFLLYGIYVSVLLMLLATEEHTC